MPFSSAQTLKVVYNPSAGNAKFLLPQTVDQYLHLHDIPYEWSTLPELRMLAQKTTQPYSILVVGGDGTLHAVLNAIGKRHLHRFTLSIIPAGTGNDFARSLNIPLDAAQAFQTLAEGYIGPVDLGILNHRICFTCAVSLGFGTEVTKHARRGLKALFGRWALYLGALCYLLLPKPMYTFQARINRHHDTRLHTPHLVIGNARTHGGGFPISPQADLQNAMLDMYYVMPVSTWQIPRLYGKILQHVDHTQLEEVRHQQLHEIRIPLDAPLDVDVDGDIYTVHRHLHAKVYPGKLTVIMPKAMALQHKLVKDPIRELVGRNSRAS